MYDFIQNEKKSSSCAFSPPSNVEKLVKLLHDFSRLRSFKTNSTTKPSQIFENNEIYLSDLLTADAVASFFIQRFNEIRKI